MKKFNYIKWKSETLPRLMEQVSGSGSGSMCVVNQQADNAGSVVNPQLGDVGINQNFINNMAGKQNAFYQARHATLTNKLTQLRANDVMPNGGLQGYCQGSNPHWQAKLNNKATYIQNCLNNPGSC